MLLAEVDETVQARYSWYDSLVVDVGLWGEEHGYRHELCVEYIIIMLERISTAAYGEKADVSRCRCRVGKVNQRHLPQPSLESHRYG